MSMIRTPGCSSQSVRARFLRCRLQAADREAGHGLSGCPYRSGNGLRNIGRCGNSSTGQPAVADHVKIPIRSIPAGGDDLWTTRQAAHSMEPVARTGQRLEPLPDGGRLPRTAADRRAGTTGPAVHSPQVARPSRVRIAPVRPPRRSRLRRSSVARRAAAPCRPTRTPRSGRCAEPRSALPERKTVVMANTTSSHPVGVRTDRSNGVVAHRE